MSIPPSTVFIDSQALNTLAACFQEKPFPHRGLDILNETRQDNELKGPTLSHKKTQKINPNDSPNPDSSSDHS